MSPFSCQPSELGPQKHYSSTLPTCHALPMPYLGLFLAQGSCSYYSYLRPLSVLTNEETSADHDPWSISFNKAGHQVRHQKDHALRLRSMMQSKEYSRPTLTTCISKPWQDPQRRESLEVEFCPWNHKTPRRKHRWQVPWHQSWWQFFGSDSKTKTTKVKPN